MKTIVDIQGNIGVGKTTFLENLEKHIDFKNNSIFLPEPVEQWKKIKDENGKNLLETFYNDMYRWSYTFQNGAYITKMKNVANALNQDKNFIFLDRSVETDKNVFAKMLYEDSLNSEKKKINKLEWQLYNEWNDFYEKYVLKECNKKTIYLRCDPYIAYNRIQQRGRPEEVGISIDYLVRLHEYHDKWILNENKKNVLTLDWNYDMIKNDSENRKMLENKINMVKDFVFAS